MSKTDKSYEAKNAWLEMEDVEKEEVFKFNKEYGTFLEENKTEREFTSGSVEMLEQEGFKRIDEVDSLQAGDKVFAVNRDRQLIAAVIGEKDLKEGLRIVAAHMDSPRIDLKPNPLYEDGGLAYFGTHYYGGIKKFQWVTIPLALRGLVIKEDGTKIEISIGEKEDDPVFYISDILPHLGKKQREKKMSEAINAQHLNLIVGSIPLDDEDEENGNDKIKSAVIKHLENEYDINGEDLVSADLQIVPAAGVRDVGFDRALLGGYGHDDRVCSYTGLKALLDTNQPEYTAVTVLVDKEEIGSMGTTGMQSRFFENVVAKITSKYYKDYSELDLREILEKSSSLSGDVNAAYDSNFSEVFDKRNAAFINKGVVLTKYTGARGKAGSSEATAEFMAQVRSLLNKAGVIWQVAELGKVDEGGGGTIAQFLANYNMDVVDAGPAVLAMHSPYEVVGKIDVYNTYLAYLTFLEN
ncbi:MAG: aminopeptidase [Halanaerobiales bacterium]|nr:aminopeptidase [Halanaerobiales bacterium]